MTIIPKFIAANYRGRIGNFAIDVAFQAPASGIIALFGPSGSGKTTILRCMAGLEKLPGGLTIAGDIWQDDAQHISLPPHRRQVGYVFQEPSLFSHLSVKDNLLYGYRRATKNKKPEITFDHIVALLGVEDLLGRSPAKLSGGERQRIAVGRALLSQPRLILMDEPLAALDRAAKEDILPYFERLHEEFSIPIFYVSHDMGEIERLADYMIIMEKGHVRALGKLADMQTDPLLPIAMATEAAVTIEGIVKAYDPVYGLASFSIDGGTLILPGSHGPVGARRRLRIKASDVSFVREMPENSTILNCLTVRILSVDPCDQARIQMNVVAQIGLKENGARMMGRITRKSQEALSIKPGTDLFIQIKSVAVLASVG